MGYATKARGVTTAPDPWATAYPVTSPADPRPAKIWSPQQEAIFAFTVEQDANLVVEALAGTGKTTTIVEAVRRYTTAFPDRRVMVCAFNKRIAEELQVRFADAGSVDVKTLHAIGFGIIRQYWGRKVRVCNRDERAKALTDAACGSQCPDGIKKLVSKLHTKARDMMPYAITGADLLPLAEKFECDPDDFWALQGYDLTYVCEKAAKAMALAFEPDDPPATGIDFADMIGLPLRKGWAVKEFDLVVVDEAQDMTVPQLDLAQAICAGRFIVVGDSNQAIYGFRGADSGSLKRLEHELEATVLGLTTTYRCGRQIVALAQRIVPTFEAGAANPEGEVCTSTAGEMLDTVGYGDFVLSRTNAPLVATAMRLLRAGKRTRVAGRDIGNGLKGLVSTLSKGTTSVPAFLERLTAWEAKQIKRATVLKWETRIALVRDQAETLHHLAMDARSVGDIVARIDALFSDDDLGHKGVITCSSVHRAKGLEADRVFVLAWTLRDRDQEEVNIRYVAITRAKHTLVMVNQ